MKNMMPAVWIRTTEGERKRKKIERKYGFLGKEEREREKRDGEKIKEKTEEKANRLQPVSLLHPTAQIFSNFLRISNGLKAFGWTVPPFHCRLDVSTSPKCVPILHKFLLAPLLKEKKKKKKNFILAK
jgi:hypothetical protein